MHPGFHLGTKGTPSYKRRVMGEGAIFWDQNKIRVSCEECEGVMAASSLCHHMEITHSIVLPHTQGVDIVGGGPEICVVSFPRELNSVV